MLSSSNKHSGDLLSCPVEPLVNNYKDKKVFFEPLWGHNGDMLIRMGSLEMFKRVGIRLVKKPSDSELIVINGGAGMSHFWRHGFQVLENYSQNFPSKPLLVLPSSWSFDPSNFPVSLSKRTAPVYFFSREPYSFELLKSVNFEEEVYLGLDHDMAFHLEGASFIKKLERRSESRHILVAERGDIESSTGLVQSLPNLMRLVQTIFPESLRKKIPKSVRDLSVELIWFLERLFFLQKNRKLAERSLFAKESIEYVLKSNTEFTELPVYAVDISLKSICSFRSFCLVIAQSGVVVTTRLHVAILSSLLGKSTFLKPGNWHKIIGVYEFSLKKRGNVKII